MELSNRAAAVGRIRKSSYSHEIPPNSSSKRGSRAVSSLLDAVEPTTRGEREKKKVKLKSLKTPRLINTVAVSQPGKA